MADTTSLVISSVTKRSQIDRRLWATPTSTSNNISGGKLGSAGVTISGAYSFFILDLASNKIVSIPNLDPANRTSYAMYQFPVPPQQYECSEPASTVVTPTQDGGKFIESHGSIYKDIRIAGTVGFRPNPASTELIPGLGAATGVQLEMPSTLQSLSLFGRDERGLSRSEATGFDDIIFLRNIFRAYWDSKQNAETARRYALVWVYAKEAESYIVEPMQFTTNRESSKPLSWTYQIQIRTLYPLSSTFKVVDDSLGFFGYVAAGRSWIQKVSRAFRDIGKFFYQMSSLVNYIARLPLNVMNYVVGDALSIMSAISDLKNTMDFSKLYTQNWQRWGDSLRNAYDIVTGVSGNENIPSNAPMFTGTVSNQEGKDGDIAKVIRDGIRVFNNLKTIDFLWTQSKQVVVRDYAAAYLDEFGAEPLTAGSPLNLSNMTIPDSAKQVTIEGGETIRSVAKRLLGDEAYWKKLAILNNLKAPYIAATSSSGVLAYGDPILIPKTLDTIEAQSGVANVTNSDADSEAQSPVLRRFGRDLGLTSYNANELVGDINVNQRGDLSTIEGLDNVNQAIMIKFSTEQGELATHSTFGALFSIGSKFPTLTRMQDFSINTQLTLRQDPRVKEIDELKIMASGDQILVNAKVSLRDADAQLPISFTVRR